MGRVVAKRVLVRTLLTSDLVILKRIPYVDPSKVGRQSRCINILCYTFFMRCQLLFLCGCSFGTGTGTGNLRSCRALAATQYDQTHDRYRDPPLCAYHGCFVRIGIQSNYRSVRLRTEKYLKGNVKREEYRGEI